MVRDALAGPGRIAMIQPLPILGERSGTSRTCPAVPCRLHRRNGRGRGTGRRAVQHRAPRVQPLPADRRARPRHRLPPGRRRPRRVRRCRAAAAEPGQRAEVEREARRFGDALGLAVDWDAVGRLDDEMLVNAIAQVAPFDVGAKQALLEEPTLAGRADLVVQLMQFQRLAPGGADIGPDASVTRSAGPGAAAAGRRWCPALRPSAGP